MHAFYKIDKERRLVLLWRTECFAGPMLQGIWKNFSKIPSLTLPTRGSRTSRKSPRSSFPLKMLTGAEIRLFAAIAPRFPCPQRTGVWTRTHVWVLRENQGEMGIRVFRGLDEALDWVFSKSTSA